MNPELLTARAGTTLYLGAPAVPSVSATGAAAIARVVAQFPVIREAHLPQLFAPGVTAEAGQALVLVLEPGIDAVPLVAALSPQVAAYAPAGKALDIWPLPANHAMLGALRRAGCQIHPAVPQRRWWEFWR